MYGYGYPKQIESVLDTRQMPIHVGDTLVYGAAVSVETRINGDILIKSHPITTAKVLHIAVVAPGWAVLGDQLEITLDNGHVLKGDSENGWGEAIYVLPRSA